MPIELYHQGNKADIYVYLNPRGEALVADFIDSLNQTDQAKVVQLIRFFGEHGEIRNTEKFRLEEKPIYALKSYQIRIPCFYLPQQGKRTLVLTHGFIKKSPRMPKPELDKAKNIYREIVSYP
jgi:phage-related protein